MCRHLENHTSNKDFIFKKINLFSIRLFSFLFNFILTFFSPIFNSKQKYKNNNEKKNNPITSLTLPITTPS